MTKKQLRLSIEIRRGDLVVRIADIEGNTLAEKNLGKITMEEVEKLLEFLEHENADIQQRAIRMSMN